MDNGHPFSDEPRPHPQPETFAAFPRVGLAASSPFDGAQSQPMCAPSHAAVLASAAVLGLAAVIVLNIHSLYVTLAIASLPCGAALICATRYTTLNPFWLPPALLLVETLPYVNVIPVSPESRWWLHYPLLFVFCLPAIPAACNKGLLKERHLTLFFVYFGWAAVSVAYSLDPLISAARLIPAVLLFATLTLIAFSTTSAADLEAVLWRFLLGCSVLLCLTAFAAFALPRRVFVEGGNSWVGTWRAAHDAAGMYTWIRDTSGLDRFEGVFYSPNKIGSLMLVTVGVALSLWRDATSRRRIALGLIIVGATVFGVMADSRSPAVALVIGISAYWMWKYRARGILICGVLALATVLAYGALSATAKVGVSRNITTLTGRTAAWRFEIQKILERPLTGYGYNVEGAIFKDPRFPDWDIFWAQGPRTSTHEGYLSIAVGLGMPALLFWLYLVLRPWVALLGRPDDPWNLKLLFFFVVLPLFCRAFAEAGIGDVHGITSPVFYLLWMVAERQRILALKAAPDKAASSSSARDFRQIFAGAALVALTAITAMIFAGPALASGSNGDSRVLIVASRPDRYFPTLPPHAPLPSGRQCAAEIPATPETIPSNIPFNRTTVSASALANFRAEGYTFERLASHAQYARIAGDYTGSTDMIMRWAACKYGIDENVVRGQAWAESFWRQWATGDKRATRAQCVQDGFTALWNTNIPLADGRRISCPYCCYTSWSAWQTKVYYEWKTWPMIKDSTSFAAEYRFADTRSCMNGDWAPYFASRAAQPGHNTYAEDVAAYAGDPTQANLDTILWGCIGMHYSGGWYDSGAVRYIANIKGNIAHRRWLTPDIHVTGP